MSETKVSEVSTILTTIPFDGFYDSSHNEILDYALEQMVSDDQGTTYPYATNLWEHVNWTQVRDAYAKRYLAEFCDQFKVETGVALPAEYDELSSPREYNFTTDRIFARITPEALHAAFDAVDKDALRKGIRERFASRSGFISFYDEDLDVWLKKDIEQWDHNQVGTVISVLFEESASDEEALSAYNLMGDARGNGFLDDILSEAMDETGKSLVDRASKDRDKGVYAKDINNEEEE